MKTTTQSVLEAVRGVSVLLFSLTASIVCGMTWWETRGLADAIKRNKNATPVISTIDLRLQKIEVDLATVKGQLMERALEKTGGGK